MEIHIDDTKKLEEIKNEFSKKYPFLKIEFFKNAHSEGNGSPKSDMISEDVAVGNIRTKHNEGDIAITGDMKVSDLEQQFEKRYGIHAQIFRKSRDLWLETSITDQWSLNDQNSTGKEMS